MWGIFLGEFQCLPVDDCPAASCDSGVLARGSESTFFYSAILVPISPSHFVNVLFISERVDIPGCGHKIFSGRVGISECHSMEIVQGCDVREL